MDNKLKKKYNKRLKNFRKILLKIINTDDYQIADEGDRELVCPNCVHKRDIAEKGLETDENIEYS